MEPSLRHGQRSFVAAFSYRSVGERDAPRMTRRPALVSQWYNSLGLRLSTNTFVEPIRLNIYTPG